MFLLKLRLSPSKNVGFVCFNESSLRMMENALFILKTLFVLKIFKFFSRIFGSYRKDDKKAKVNSKIYVVTNWE